MLQRMGVSFENLEGVEEVILKMKDKSIILKNPEVVIANISGQKLYQIVSSQEIEERIEKERTYEPNEEDISLVMQQANATREEAINALKETEGDIASAIILIKARKS